jgi:SAM-dependent methyltransferase
MDNSWDTEYKNMWNDRYKETEFVYGKEPNLFFKEWIKKFAPQTLLMPADGEGRNGVFAAQLGWIVTSFDLSIEGKFKALELAKDKNTSINYIVCDFEQLYFDDLSFDAIGLVYAHFAAEKKSIFHNKLSGILKTGGIIILEAFSKKHIHLNSINPKVGGPKDIAMLYSKEEILLDFINYEILYLEEEEIDLNEGKFHIGKGSVIRFVAKKK